MKMDLTQLFGSIVGNAQDARDQFERGFDGEAFDRLEVISKTITVLKDFKSSVDALHDVNPQQSSIASTSTPAKSTKRPHDSNFEKSRKTIKSNAEDTPTITSEHQQPIYTSSGDLIPSPPRTHSHAPLDPNLLRNLDEIFVTWKMQKLSESPDFRPFKFRIQAFTNAFHEELLHNGYTEEVLPMRKVKNYLWTQRYISRFNEDGKKAKSKGNHVWNIEAKKTPAGGWVFREFTRKIAGIPNKVAYVGAKYTYSPRVWDPQAVFHSTWLPDWLRWENNILTGTPDMNSQSCEITAIANYYHGDTVYKLEKSFYITVVAHVDSTEHHELNPMAIGDYQLQ
ncbi:11442_t:CDS:2 [Entrophospora sp. SA101]|nr:11442_t:CDS:2 [Entrophospora sp. SA101]